MSAHANINPSGFRVEEVDRNRLQHIIKSGGAGGLWCWRGHGGAGRLGGHHVVSTLRSRNKTSAASGGKQSRTEGERGWEWGGGRKRRREKLS